MKIYDLEAVLPSPRGDTSAFYYYKSKLNSYNFTIVELTKKTPEENKKHPPYDHVHCFFCNETDAKRGSIEIGSCVYKYLKMIDQIATRPVNIIFYSDNCGGQAKNKFITSLYLYAVTTLKNIDTITHKFLIKGLRQNEGDNVHSLVEKEIKKILKSGPIYIPPQYIPLIKNAKKTGTPFYVHELDFHAFVDCKNLQEQWGYNFNENT